MNWKRTKLDQTPPNPRKSARLLFFLEGCPDLLLLAVAKVIPCHEFIDRWFDFLFELRDYLGASSGAGGEGGGEPILD